MSEKIDLKVGDKVRLTGRLWSEDEDYPVNTGDVVTVNEIIDGSAYAKGAEALTNRGVPLRGYEIEKVSYAPVPEARQVTLPGVVADIKTLIEEARIIRDALTEFLDNTEDRPKLGQEESTMKTIEEVAAEVAADWHEEGKTRDADLRLAIEAIRAWEAQRPQDDEIYIVTDDTGEVLDVFSTEEEAKLFIDDRDDVTLWEETVWAPGAYTAEHERLKANKCDECDEQATNHWPNLKEPVQMCDGCTHNARRSGWEPGQ